MDWSRWVEKVVEGLLGGEDVAAAEPSWENLETLVLVLLCGGLWLILWRRRSIRQQQAAVFQAPAQVQPSSPPSCSSLLPFPSMQSSAT